MPLKSEVLEQLGLDEEKSKVLLESVEEIESTLSASANTNAEGILNGVAVSVEKLTGIKREKGQKYADYLSSASDNYFAGKTASLEKKEADLEARLKSAGTKEGVAEELESVKEQLRVLKEQEAKFAEWEENDYKGKYEEATNELSSIKENSAFNAAKPKFPESANEFEINYKWDKFKTGIKEKYNLINKDGETYVQDKENEFKTYKLSEMVKKDADLNALLNKKPDGLGSKGKKDVQLDGIPFTLPENASSIEKSTAIKEYLLKKGLSVTSDAYSTEFTEIMSKINKSQKTA